MAKSVKDSKWLLHKPDGYGIRSTTTKEGERWHQGTVSTPIGYVKVYAERSYLILSVIKGGTVFDRVYRGVTYTPRRIVTLAHRFISEIAP